MEQHFVIQGLAIRDIPSFYAEVNRVFMRAEDWQLGNSLDAFNDLLYGGFGGIVGNGPVVIEWKDMEYSRQSLGYAVTKGYYEEKLLPGSPFDKDHFRRQLEALEKGHGQTYFDVILEVIADHPNVVLRVS